MQPIAFRHSGVIPWHGTFIGKGADVVSAAISAQSEIGIEVV